MMVYVPFLLYLFQLGDPDFSLHVSVMWQYPSFEMDAQLHKLIDIHCLMHSSLVFPGPPKVHILSPSKVHSSHEWHCHSNSFSHPTVETIVNYFINYSYKNSMRQKNCFDKKINSDLIYLLGSFVQIHSVVVIAKCFENETILIWAKINRNM